MSAYNYDAPSCTYHGAPLHVYKFTGKERDTESGLDNFGARYNASTMGRFMSPDPLGGRLANPQTLNKYSYVINNPLRYTDPTGLYICSDSTKDHNCTSDKDVAFANSLKNDLQSKDPDVVRAAQAYGEKNVDNGVTVGFHAGDSVTTSTLVTDGSGNISSRSDVEINENKTGAGLDASVGHEGSHVADGGWPGFSLAPKPQWVPRSLRTLQRAATNACASGFT